MERIEASDAGPKLEELLDRVAGGEEILIVRHGRVAGRLVPPPAAFDRERARAAAADIRAMRKGVTLGGLSIKDLINEGRR